MQQSVGRMHAARLKGIRAEPAGPASGVDVRLYDGWKGLCHAKTEMTSLTRRYHICI
jgi:hypothetical protein